MGHNVHYIVLGHLIHCACSVMLPVPLRLVYVFFTTEICEALQVTNTRITQLFHLELEVAVCLSSLKLELTPSSSSLSVPLTACCRLLLKALSNLSRHLDLWGRWLNFTLALLNLALGILAKEIEMHTTITQIFQMREDLRSGKFKKDGHLTQFSQAHLFSYSVVTLSTHLWYHFSSKVLSFPMYKVFFRIRDGPPALDITQFFVDPWRFLKTLIGHSS